MTDTPMVSVTERLPPISITTTIFADGNRGEIVLSIPSPTLDALAMAHRIIAQAIELRDAAWPASPGFATERRTFTTSVIARILPAEMSAARVAAVRGALATAASREATTKSRSVRIGPAKFAVIVDGNPT